MASWLPASTPGEGPLYPTAFHQSISQRPLPRQLLETVLWRLAHTPHSSISTSSGVLCRSPAHLFPSHPGGRFPTPLLIPAPSDSPQSRASPSGMAPVSWMPNKYFYILQRQIFFPFNTSSSSSVWWGPDSPVAPFSAMPTCRITARIPLPREGIHKGFLFHASLNPSVVMMFCPTALSLNCGQGRPGGLDRLAVPFFFLVHAVPTPPRAASRMHRSP